MAELAVVGNEHIAHGQVPVDRIAGTESGNASAGLDIEMCVRLVQPVINEVVPVIH